MSAQSTTTPLTLAHMSLIDALAHSDVQDYLREQAAQQRASNDARPNPATLQPATKAA